MSSICSFVMGKRTNKVPSWFRISRMRWDKELGEFEDEFRKSKLELHKL